MNIAAEVPMAYERLCSRMSTDLRKRNSGLQTVKGLPGGELWLLEQIELLQSMPEDANFRAACLAGDLMRCMVVLSIWNESFMTGFREGIHTALPEIEHRVEEPTLLGSLYFDRASRRVDWNGQRVTLTPIRFRLLDVLILRPGRCVPYQEFIRIMYPGGFHVGKDDNARRTNVRGHMKGIRRAFQDIDASFDWIETHGGVGYSWRIPDTDVPGA